MGVVVIVFSPVGYYYLVVTQGSIEVGFKRQRHDTPRS